LLENVESVQALAYSLALFQCKFAVWGVKILVNMILLLAVFLVKYGITREEDFTRLSLARKLSQARS
jgi:hypothetical protein